MIYGYARVWTNVQSVAAQAVALRKHRAGKMFREGASGAKTDRANLRRLLDQLADIARSYNVSQATISRLGT
jgi:Resolvase, N terminal domain